MQIKMMDVADIRVAPYNPRVDLQPGDPEYEALRNSLERWDIVDPLVFNTRSGRLVGGHQRFKIIRDHLKRKKVPVVEVNLSDDDERALNVALNKIGGRFDEDKLGEVLLGLRDSGYDTTLTGFDDAELKALLGSVWSVPTDPVSSGAADALPPPVTPVISKAGDIWELGDHRLICGDATTSAVFERLFASLPDRKDAALVLTDPPYGVNYESASGKHAKLKGDEKTGDDLVRKLLIPTFRNAVAHANETSAFYIWHASSSREAFLLAMKTVGIVERQQIVWAKNNFVLGHADYHWGHELCSYAGLDGQRPPFYGDRTQATVWTVSLSKKLTKDEARRVATAIGPGVLLTHQDGGQIYVTAKPPKNKAKRQIMVEAGTVVALTPDHTCSTVWSVAKEAGAEHPTQKPVELNIRAIENSSKSGDVVLDPFMGSGSTLIAAELTNRVCVGVEIDPGFCDLIVRRWEEVTGKKASRSVQTAKALKELAKKIVKKKVEK